MASSDVYPSFFQQGDFVDTPEYSFTSDEKKIPSVNSPYQCCRVCVKRIAEGHICDGTKGPNQTDLTCTPQDKAELVDFRLRERVVKVVQLHNLYEAYLQLLRRRHGRELTRDDVIDDACAKQAASRLFAGQRALNRIFIAEEAMATGAGAEIWKVNSSDAWNAQRRRKAQDFLGAVLAGMEISEYAAQGGEEQWSASPTNPHPSVRIEADPGSMAVGSFATWEEFDNALTQMDRAASSSAAPASREEDSDGSEEA